MKGISSGGKRVIESSIEKLFNDVAYKLLGPFTRQSKSILFTSKGPSKTLAHLFVQAMNNREPNAKERDLLKGLLGTAENYISSLRDRTKSNVIDAIDGEIKSKGSISPDKIKEIVGREMGKSRDHMKLITEAESTKVRNHGAAMDILKVGDAIGTKDPVCYFVVVHDDATCKYCLNNHLLSDQKTPRVFKFSQIKHTYLTTADRKAGEVSTAGQHPHCRCTLVMLSPGFGFKDGKAAWIGMGHDELGSQNTGISAGS